MKIPFLDLKKADAPLQPAIQVAIGEVAASGRYLNGPATAAFQRSMEELHSMPEGSAVAVSNGLDALRLIFRAYMELGLLQEGDEVIVPANTYIASIMPLTEHGLVPVLVEPDYATMILSWEKAEAAVGPRTRALLTVHLYGTPAWDAEIAGRMAASGLIIVEDNAQAIGARACAPGLNGTDITGALGHASAFSFYPTKNIGALGDAGMVLTADARLASTVKALANYGSDRRYHNIYRGYNCRMDELQAAALNVKLKALDDVCSSRREIAAIYDREICNPFVSKPQVMPGGGQVWHQYVVRTPLRNSLREHLANCGVATDVHYAVPPHLQPCYEGLCHGPLPVTERIASEVVSLPIGSLSPVEAEYVARMVNGWQP